MRPSGLLQRLKGMMNKFEIRTQELITLLPEFLSLNNQEIFNISKVIVNSLVHNKKVLICGNGGSAADAQHLAAEFVNAFSRDIERKALPAISLATDTSVITSISNDFGYDRIFSRQVEALGNAGDVLISFSTSGESKNCIEAIKTASKLGLISIAFTKVGSQLAKISNYSICVPSSNTQHIQECHIIAYHCLTEVIEDSLFRSQNV